MSKHKTYGAEVFDLTNVRVVVKRSKKQSLSQLRRAYAKLSKDNESLTFSVNERNLKIQELLKEREWLRQLVVGITVSRTGSPDVVAKAMGIYK